MKRLIPAVLFLLQAGILFGAGLPVSRYFPITTDFSFRLASTSGSQLLFKSRIEIPEEAREMGHVFVNWDMFWKQSETLLRYRFRFRVSEEGEFFLVAIDDGIYYRSIPEDLVLFTNNPRTGTVIDIGEGISLKYVNQWSTRQLAGKNWSGVVQVELRLQDRRIQLYLAQGAGIIAIQSDEETYIHQS